MLQPSICPASESSWSVFMCSNPSDRTHTISTNRTSRARVMGMQTKKGCSFLLGTAFLRDSDRIQTCNLLIRSQMLYSVELRSLVSCLRLQRYAYFLFPPNFFRYFFVFFFKKHQKKHISPTLPPSIWARICDISRQGALSHILSGMTIRLPCLH